MYCGVMHNDCSYNPHPNCLPHAAHDATADDAAAAADAGKDAGGPAGFDKLEIAAHGWYGVVLCTSYADGNHSLS